MTPPKIAIDTARGLMSGLGVEDVAVRHGYRIEDVRAVVADMRRRGVLSNIAVQFRNEARKQLIDATRRRSDRGR